MAIGQLQTITSFSLLKSTIQIPQMVLTAKELGYKSLAITDINTMHGIIEFYKTCLIHDIKPIIGLTLTYNSEFIDNKEFHLVLLAKDTIGYQNLIAISTLRMEEENNLFPIESISHLLEGIVIISPWDEKTSELKSILHYNKNLFNECLNKRMSLFSNDSFYQGISAVCEHESMQEVIDTFRSEKIKLVSLEDVRYLQSEDFFCVEVLNHIATNEKMVIDFNQMNGPNYFLKKDRVVDQLNKSDLTDAIDHNNDIVEMCNVDIKLHQTLLPKFPLNKTNASSSKEYLEALCLNGLEQKSLDTKRDYIDRIKMELDVINDMGFNDYFLIVWDVMKYARDHHIVTACRGSAAGSLVSYSLDITNVDPIKYGLLFERFLNKERYTMPDIDMDIPDNRREEVLKYVHEKYGHQKVAQIATFGTLAAKMALRDVARVFGLSQNESNKWSNAVPNLLKITLEEAYNQSNQLQELVGHSQKNELLFETAKKIEGLPRHISTHAAGVVISDNELTQYLPLQKGSNGIPLTQFTMGDVEEIGLLKMDFLGLRNLSIIGNTIDSIKFTKNIEIKLDDIPLDDEKTLELFRKGETVGIFQFESEGIKRVLKKLKPTSIEDIASVNALYRPGPMQNIDQFIARKHKNEEITYPHDNLKGILNVTYGIIVYQEQIMQIASLMAGFSLGQADILRRAISKKKKDVLDIERDHFVKGSITKGYTQEVAQEVYQYIEHFANYGFNRSHAVVYAVLAYQMAYLKVHYPENFFTSLLHSVRNSPSKTNEYLLDAKRKGVKFLIPDINKSESSFKIVNGKTIFGLSSIKGIRKDFVKEIVDNRKEIGNFTSFENFLVRIDRKWRKENYLLPLIHAGAFDYLNSNRKQLIVDLNNTINNIDYTGGNSDLLDVLSLKKEKVADFTLIEKLNHEYQYLGSYISLHPVDAFDHLKKGRQIISLSEGKKGLTGNFLIFVLNKKSIRTKKGELMYILSANDGSKEIEVVIFPKLLRKLQLTIEENEVYLLRGKITENTYNQQLQLLAEELVLAKEVKDFDHEKKCYIKISKENDQLRILNQIKQLLIRFKGSHPVILVFDDKTILLEETYWVTESPKFIDEMHQFLGKETIVFR